MSAGLMRNKTLRVGLLLATLAMCALALSSGAGAQPAAPQPPPPAAVPAPAAGQPAMPNVGPDRRPAPAAPAAPAAGQPGLPNWHPPVGQGRPPASPDQRRKQLEMLRELARKRDQQGANGAAPSPAHGAPSHATTSHAKYPVDEHGYCVGDGPNDVPRPINLVHGWLGHKDQYAPEDGTWGPKRPPRLEPRTSDMSFIDNQLRQLPYWKWRLTPYPYRYDNHEDHCDPKNQPVPLLANIVNVAVLFFLIRRFGRKPLLDGLKGRKSAIMGEIERARAIRKNAEERLDKYQDELENLDDKLAALRQQYADEGETEEKRLVNELGETRDRVMNDVEFRISQESKSARDELSHEALQAALTAAETLLEQRITEADHQRLAEEYLEQIGPAMAAQLNMKAGLKGGKDA